MESHLKTYLSAALLSLVIPIYGQDRQQPRLQWGAYAQGGAALFLNQYHYDRELYHFPPGIHVRAGSLTAWKPAPFHRVILETVVDHTQIRFTATGYNNNWSSIRCSQWSIGAGIHYRIAVPLLPRFWIQAGLQQRYRLNPEAITLTASRHSNDNNVREVLAAVYTGTLRRWETSVPVTAGYYLDKQHRHELALFAGAGISRMFQKGREAFMRHSFTFADGTAAGFSAHINGISIPLGVRYACWF